VVLLGPLVRAVSAVAPAPLRDRIRADAAATIAHVIREVRDRRGVGAACLAAAAEMRALSGAAIRARLRLEPSLTAGARPTPPPRTGGPIMSRLASDLRQAWRALLRSPGYAAVVVLTLGLGIGINTAVFSVVDSLMLRPAPYPDAGRLGHLWTQLPPRPGAAASQQAISFRGGFTAALIREWRAQTDLFDRVEAFESRSRVLEIDGGAEMVAVSTITPGLLPMLGATPMIGRLFADGDGRDGTRRIAVVSEGFWRHTLRRDEAVPGREIVLDGERYAIVGVLPSTFRYPDEQQRVWIPFDVQMPPSGSTAPTSLVPIARFAGALSFDDAAARVSARGQGVNQRAGGDGSSATLQPLSSRLDDRERRSLYVLGGAAFFLLLIVCANVANLTLARALGRARERAVRSALGASRLDLIREAAIEHAALGAIGALAGAAAAALFVRATAGLLPSELTISSLNAVDVDARALGFLVVATAVTVVLFGLAPAVTSGRRPMVERLASAARGSSDSRLARRVRGALVVVEVALSLVLLVGAALMTRTVVKLYAIDTGLDPEGLVTVRVAYPAAGYADAAARRLFTASVLDRLIGRPGIERASAGQLPPDARHVFVGPLEFADRPGERTPQQVLRVFDAWPGTFATAGIAILDGRAIESSEAPGTVVVSEGFARRYWPEMSAVGRRFRVGDTDWRTVVGVAAEVRRLTDRGDEEEHELYLPADQFERPGLYYAERPTTTIAGYGMLTARTADAVTAIGEIRAAVRGVDPRVVVVRTQLVSHAFADAIARPRIVLLMMAVFAGFGLLLAVAGLHAVLTYLVARREREIGIRLAVGATPGSVGRSVVASGLALVALGTAVGLASALRLVDAMRALLYEVDAVDPVSLTLVVLTIAIAALAACAAPARRAMRADPLALLRQD
jgi:predicted permease